MNDNILLSLAVTTYNRRDFLETAVNRYIKQILNGGLEKEVEIVISNDASPDNTFEYVTKIDSQYSFIRGFNQPKNLGVTKNLEWIVNEARGEYVQLCGDDDLFADDAITTIVKKLKATKPNFVLVNTNNIHSLDNSNIKYKVVMENRLHIHNDIFMEEFRKDYTALTQAHHWWYLTNFITANIFKKDLWQKEMETAKKYLQPKNVFLWQAPVIIGISTYGKLLLISDCLILCRKNPTDNYVLDPRGRYYINICENIEISKLIKIFMPTIYKEHKKIYAAFVMDSFILETNNNRDVRKPAFIALGNYLDCFPENIQFFSMAIAPKFISRIAPTLKKYKRLYY